MKTKTKTYHCHTCGRRLTAYRDPEPDDEIICVDCEDQRDEARRDAALETR